MTRKHMTPLLVLAALAVLAENVIFFRSDSVHWDETIDLDGSDADEGASRTVPPLAAAALASFLTQLTAHGDERNPFLTRLEADSLRPQFAASLQTTGPSMPPQLDGILWNDTNPVAWLGGRPYSEGDVAGGYRIEQIAPRTVRLRAGPELLQLRLQNATSAPGASSPRTPHATEVENDDE